VSANRQRPLKPAYLIVGNDLPKVELALKRLKARIVSQPGGETNLDEFDAGQEPAATVVNAANTLSFLGGVRLVLVKRVELWSREDKELVAAYLRSPSPGTCLTLVAEKLAPGDVLRTVIKQQGEILEYVAPTESRLPGWLVEEAVKRFQLTLGLPEARLLIERCGTDQNLLLREAEKLSLYAGGRRVTAEDIRLLASPTAEASIFDLVDSLALGKGAEAFATAGELLSAGEEPVRILAVIMRHFQNLSRVAAMRDAGMSREEIQNEMKVKPFVLGKLLEQSTLLGLPGISRRLRILAETDARLKGAGTLSPEIELELCLGKLLSA